MGVFELGGFLRGKAEFFCAFETREGYRMMNRRC